MGVPGSAHNAFPLGREEVATPRIKDINPHLQYSFYEECRFS